MPKMSAFFNTPVNTEKKQQTVHRAIDYTKLLENPHQYRTFTTEDVAALADLILADGKVLQPLLVRKAGQDTFEIIAGHKRRAAIKYIVETLDMPEFRLIPCNVEDLTDAQAEFAVYSTNGYGKKTPHEMMCEVEGMIRLIKEHPEDFSIPKGTRTIEAIAESLGISRTVASEYHALANNLSEEGKEALKDDKISKSAAIALSQKSKEEQKRILEDSSARTVSEIKEEAPLPDDDDIMDAYTYLEDRYTTDYAEFKARILELCHMHLGHYGSDCAIEFRMPGHVAINGKRVITITALVKRITERVPMTMRLKAHNNNKAAVADPTDVSEDEKTASAHVAPSKTFSAPELDQLRSVAFKAVTAFLEPVLTSDSTAAWTTDKLIDMANDFADRLQHDTNLLSSLKLL